MVMTRPKRRQFPNVNIFLGGEAFKEREEQF